MQVGREAMLFCVFLNDQTAPAGAVAITLKRIAIRSSHSPPVAQR